MSPGQNCFLSGGSMAALEQITRGLEKGIDDYKSIAGPSGNDIFPAAASEIRSELALADNAEYIRQLLLEGYAGRFSLIYIDPPFFTKAKFNAAVTVRDSGGTSHRIRHLAFDDRFERSLEYYIRNMTVRILLMKDLLADDGLMWIHLDWHSSHYVKLLLDELMGEKNFVNEIIWCYKSGGSGKRHFSRKHDTILVYSKTRNYKINIPQEKSYNRGFKPYNFKGVKEYCDDQGWYTLVNMKDIWNVDMVGRTSAERTGYATQKPIELMRRIIKAGSSEGDLVGDFFCGSGSFPAAAEELGRKWIGCDNERLAVSASRKRLKAAGADFAFRQAQSDFIYGKADISVFDAETLENGNKLVRMGITDFMPQIETGYIQVNDRSYAEEAAASDPIQFIDYIMIDDDYSGDFTCREMITGDFRDMRMILRGRTAAVAVDVFGHEYFAEIDTGSEKD